MFKRRGQNNKVLNNTQANQLTQIQRQEQDKLKNRNDHNLSEINQNIQFQSSLTKKNDNNNKMRTQNQKIDEDQWFLQRLQRDKKLESLFQKFQKSENNQVSQQIEQSYANNAQISYDLNDKEKVNVKPTTIYIKKKIDFNININIFAVGTKTKNQQKKEKTQVQSIRQKNQVKKHVQDKQMQDIFKEILEQNKNQVNDTQQYQQLHGQKQAEIDLTDKVIKKTNQLIIQDDDGFVQQVKKNQFTYSQIKDSSNLMLKVSVDYEEDNLSPQISQNDEDNEQYRPHTYEQDYEDILIRKTLTRTNYSKLLQKSNLKQTKQTQQKQRIFNRILKTSWFDIQNKLSSDVNLKLNRKDELTKQMQYLEERIRDRQAQMDKKNSTLLELQNQHKTLKKVIYFLCYFGDQVGIGQNQSVQTFFNDLTANIIAKIQKLSDKVNIEDFMQKQQDREKLREKYRNGRKKIKLGQHAEGQEQVIIQKQFEEQDDQDDGQIYIDQDDY